MDLDHERSSMVQILRGDLAMERLSAATTRRLPRSSDCRFLGDLGPVFLPGPQRSSPTSDRLIGVEPSTPPWSTRAIQWKAIFHLPGTGTGTGTLTGGPEIRDRPLAALGSEARVVAAGEQRILGSCWQLTGMLRIVVRSQQSLQVEGHEPPQQVRALADPQDPLLGIHDDAMCRDQGVDCRAIAERKRA